MRRVAGRLLVAMLLVGPVLAQDAGSRVIDLQPDGGSACEISFAYAGQPSETLIWDEPCDAITALMLDQAELEKLGRWARLDSFEQRFVQALPQGKVLYVEGSFSASVYPIGTSGSTYEVPVTD